MQCDLLLRNVRLEGCPELVDVAIENQKIARVGRLAKAGAKEMVDAEGALASPPFIDAHTHLDKALFQPRPNQSGTLAEAIEIMSRASSRILIDSIQERVDRVLNWAFKHGTLAVRTHVDITGAHSALALEEILKVRERWSDYIDIQIVAFPQEGLFGSEPVWRYLKEALRNGADVVGGIPAIEETEKLSRRHIEKILELAAEFDVDVDMHVDESDDPNSVTLEALADMTIAAGWQGRVTAAHCCALAAYSPEYAREVMEKVKSAQINVVTNPTTNLVLQGRGDRGPKRRGLTLVKELLELGVNVSLGQDNIRDVFNPFGKGDMLDIAFVTALAAHMTGEQEIKKVFDMPRHNAARILNIKDYGSREGGGADMVLLKADSPADAIATRPPRDWIVRRGKIFPAHSISQGVI